MWTNFQETADLVTFTEEILEGKRHVLCSVRKLNMIHKVGVTDMDLSNAFDSLNHELFIAKLRFAVSTILSDACWVPWFFQKPVK